MSFKATLRKNYDGTFSIWIFRDGWVELVDFYELEELELMGMMLIEENKHVS